MTTPNSATHRFASTLFATTAITCFACWAFALLLVHVLRPDRALATTWISGYAVGPYGWVMTTGWLAAGCGCLMLALGLARSGPQSPAGKVGRRLLGILSLGFLITAIFPPGENSISGEIHSLFFFVNVASFLLASVLLAVSYRSDPRWRNFRRTATILASLLWSAFALQFLTAYFQVFYGLVNRFFVTVIIVWLLATSIRLRAVERGSAEQVSPSAAT
jgi:Protein of unknown function (DUF998)